MHCVIYLPVYGTILLLSQAALLDFGKRQRNLRSLSLNDRNIVQAEEFSLAMGYGTHDTLLWSFSRYDWDLAIFFDIGQVQPRPILTNTEHWQFLNNGLCP
ncbi:hypothetical protein HBI88_172560 [Parastagonospora nodorum]|nr:hypothetical protein HBI46_211360 [Parastagonospora nodorum]KAH5761139.1 hypothetical protein HBI97_192500 [Parastagonospora nodorum]KAH5819428.1 hypothetical protein HBI96_052820 [Parastagonospora nodorum]KAH5820719.1 hypothetical protein HBI93_179950 [Parastagonospora nodorum]KAH5836479.1 hypothetical protein HBI94_010030 [Parastagonospora nodorum]